MARGGGFEPPLPGPKPGVLPLDDPRAQAISENKPKGYEGMFQFNPDIINFQVEKSDN